MSETIEDLLNRNFCYIEIHFDFRDFRDSASSIVLGKG